ncbi:aromatic acid exporter family protein [Anaerosporobacter sp.]
MNKNSILQVIKIAIGSTLAIIICNILNLKYSTSAGVITLLTIQGTKKETLKIAGKRVLAYFMSLIIAFVVFNIWGYHIWAFAIYMFLSVLFCFLLGLQDALSICTVITTHFMMEGNMNPALIENETLLLTVGVGIGIILNLYMPTMRDEILRDQEAVEEDMRKLICTVADNMLLHNKEDEERFCFDTLERDVDAAIAKAYENVNNNLISDTKYYLEYMEMRKRQCVVLKRLYMSVDLLKHTYRQHYIIAEFMKEMSNHFHEYDDSVVLAERLDVIQEEVGRDELPTTREEFESRAVLYFIITELKVFLDIKIDFIQTLNESELQKYWRKRNKK